MSNLEEKYTKLTRILQKYGKVCVAFSGGVDSTLLLYAASETLRGNVMAVMAYGEFVPERELDEALAFCESEGIIHSILPVGFLANPLVASNPADRCYHCKYMLFEHILKAAHDKGFTNVIEGTNADDIHDFRPGLQALSVLGIQSPLLEAGLSKVEIRQLLKERGIPFWDKPARSCLASRIPIGVPITREALKRIESAEAILEELALGQYRVRVHGDIARIEVDSSEFALVLSNREQLVSKYQSLGFRYVSLDLAGYRTGSMNNPHPV